MSRHPGVAALLDRAAARSLEQKNADAVGRKAQAVRKAALDAKNADGRARNVDARVPRDDGIAPLAPLGFTAVATLGRQLDFSWLQPPDSDYVTHTIIEYIPQGQSARQIRGTNVSAYANNLEPVLTSVRARFVDRWGRLGAWSASVTATPKKTVAEAIDFTRAEIAGALGWANLDPLTNAANLGDDVVTARAMATQNLAAMKLWVGTAAIETAMIKDLSVDKLTAGTFTAGQITLAGAGALKAGATMISSDGITLPTLAEFTEPARDLDSKITNASNTASMHFYSQAASGSSDHRGIVISARGNGGSYRGNVMIEARSSMTSGRAAFIGIGSSSSGSGGGAQPTVYCGPTLLAEGNLEVRGDAFISRMYFQHADGSYRRVYYDNGSGNLFINT